MRLILFLIFTSVLYMATLKAQKASHLVADSQSEVFGEEYFPLKEKSEFVFDSNIGSTKAAVYKEGSSMVFKYESGPITYNQSLSKAANGIYLTKVTSKALLWGSSVTYNKPVLRLPLPLRIGNKWSWHGYEIDNGDTTALSLYGFAQAVETIKTKAGQFRCLKVMIKIISGKGETSTEAEWLAPGIGIVRSMAKIDGGSGVTALIRRMMGLQEIKFSLSEIK